MSKNFDKSKGNSSRNKRWNNKYNGKDSNKNRPLDSEVRGPSGMINAQDPFWYAQDQKAIENMASFPWNEVVGSRFPGIGAKDNSDKTPAIVVYPVWHMIGSGDVSKNNYLTRAADSYYQYVTQGFTGSVDFEAPDLLFTALAAESLLSVMIEGKRAYGMMRYYLQSNKYYAKTMIDALGFSYESLKKDLAEFRSQYNIRVSQLNKIIAVPKSFFIGDRWEYLSSWIFTDTDSPEYSTAYAYKIAAALKYEATASTTGTALSWAVKPYNNMTVDQFFDYIDELVNALIDNDARDVFGAVRRVYDDSQLKTISELDEDFTTTIVRNDIIAMSLHNAMPLGQFQASITAKDKPSIMLPLVQTPIGAIASTVYGNYMGGSASIGENTYPCVYEPKEFILDMYDHTISPANVLDATASMITLDYDDRILNESGGIVLAKVICRSEIISLPIMYSLYDNGQSEAAVYAPIYISNPHFTFAANSNGATWTKSDATKRISEFSHLDSHTIMRVMDTPTVDNITIGDKSTQVYRFHAVMAYIGEIDKYTGISAEKLSQMHEKSQYQLLSMPSNAKSVTK